MKKTKDIIIKGIIFSLVPGVFNYLGSTNFLNWAQTNQYIGKNVNIELIKTIFFIISLFLCFGLLSCNLIKTELRESQFKKQSTDLLKYTKEIMVNALSNALGKDYCELNIRIFVPHKSLLWKLQCLFHKQERLDFGIKNIEGLADEGVTGNLKFRVLPKNERQGLVGECFSCKKMVYDDNLIKSNKTNYNLTEYQINKTNDLRFIIVCPTFSQDTSIDAIVAFDSKSNIKVTKENEEILTRLILNYTQQLHERVPELFRAKGGLL